MSSLIRVVICKLQVNTNTCFKCSLAVYLTGPPIGSLFSSASIPFHHVKKYHYRPSQRKRTIDNDQAVDSVSSAKRHKHQPQLCDNCESTSGHIDSSTSHVNLQPNPLETSELYLTAHESPVDDSSLENPAISLSHCESPDRGKKRKHYNNMQLISKKRLKLSYSEVIEAPRARGITTIKKKGYFHNYYLITIL